jgi:hypothetical protein
VYREMFLHAEPFPEPRSLVLASGRADQGGVIYGHLYMSYLAVRRAFRGGVGRLPRRQRFHFLVRESRLMVAELCDQPLVRRA